VRIGENVPEMFRSDMQIEVEAVDRLRRGAEYMRSVSDITSAKLFEDILADEEHHIDYLETQLALIETLGEALYLQNVTKHPDPE
jgi:bacterioferritin